MIDEELYQKAADELNSERRRPHIWARACALADDDHDEARYLYTNLRVEELLAEAEREGGESESSATPETLEDELALEPIEFEPLPDVGDGRVSSFAAGQGTGSTPLPDAADDGAPRPTSVRTRMAFDLENDATLDLDPADVRRLEDAGGGGAVPTTDAEVGGEAAGHRTAVDDRDAAADDARVGFDPRADENADEGVGGAPDARTEPLEALFATGETVRDLSGDPPPGEVRTPWEEDLPSLDAAADDARSEDSPAAGGALAPARLDDELAGEVAGDPARRAGTGEGAAEPIAERQPDPAHDSVVETVDPDEVGIDDTVALDPARPIPGRTDEHAHPLDDLDWLGEAHRTGRQDLDASSPSNRNAEDGDGDPLTRELRRQAEELPDGGSGAVIAHETTDTLPVRRVGHDAVDAEPRTAHDDARPPGTTDGGDDAFALTDGPLEITDERGGAEEFAVFVDAAGQRAPQAVRQGGSWGALVATVPWLLYRRLIGTAIVYVLFAVVVLGGLAATGLAWSEAGESASTVTRGATVAFALLALIGLVVVPFRNANHWREDKLERRGFDLVAYVRTRDRERAVALARDVDDRRPTG